MLLFNQRTNQLYQKIKEIIDSGELGEIRRSNWIINSWWRPDSYYRQSGWRATWGGEGGGVLANAALLSAWLGKEVENPVDEELYLQELNRHIAQEGKFPTR